MMDIHGEDICSTYTTSYICENTENLDKKPDYLTDKQAEWYLNFYGDLRNAFGTNLSRAKKHWVSNGIREGRKWLKDDGGKVKRNLITNIRKLQNIC